MMSDDRQDLRLPEPGDLNPKDYKRQSMEELLGTGSAEYSSMTHASAPSEDRTIALAYDGSVCNTWVARYAIRFAANAREKRLHLVHIEDDLSRVRCDLTEQRIAALVVDANSVGVEIEVQRAPRTRHIAVDIERLVPTGPQHFIICGLRLKPRKGSFLAHTVSESLLSHGTHNVLAIRVLDPGLLGMPRRLLYAMSKNPSSAQKAEPFLSLFAPDLDHLTIFHVADVGTTRFERMSAVQVQRLLNEGRGYVAQRSQRLKHLFHDMHMSIDLHTVVSDDWPKELLIHAGRTQSKLSLIGATERSLPMRYIFGNPLEQVLRSAPCDVAIFHRAGDD